MPKFQRNNGSKLNIKIRKIDLLLGMCEAIHCDGEFIYDVDSNGEYFLKKNLLRKISEEGTPFWKIRNLFHFHTIDDPIVGRAFKIKNRKSVHAYYQKHIILSYTLLKF